MADLHAAFSGWWAEHSLRVSELPKTRALNAARRELLESFTAALLPIGVLDRFKLAGVVATWWTDTLPDFKTLLENAFAGVIDGWIDAIADAVEDDENVGPAFDPFAHKLVRRVRADYLARIDDAKAEIARLKGEKEAFEQSNPPEDADEDELANWNYAKDLATRIKELKADNRDALRELKRLERAANKKKATEVERAAFAAGRAALEPVFNQLAALESDLAPYEAIKNELAEARRRYRELMSDFVEELRARCAIFHDEERQTLVLELFASDLQAGLDTAVSGRRQMLVRITENLWDKYAIPLDEIQQERRRLQSHLAEMIGGLGYVG